MYKLGIDVGGTNTDAVLIQRSSIPLRRISTTALCVPCVKFYRSPV